MKDKVLVIPAGGIINTDAAGRYLRLADGTEGIRVKGAGGTLNKRLRVGEDVTLGDQLPEINDLEIENLDPDLEQKIVLEHGYGRAGKSNTALVAEISRVVETVNVDQVPVIVSAKSLDDVTVLAGQTNEIVLNSAEKNVVSALITRIDAGALNGRIGGAGTSATAGTLFAIGDQYSTAANTVTITAPAGESVTVSVSVDEA